MLQALRDKSAGWFTIGLLGFMALLLVLSGLQGYVVSQMDTGLAKVGDSSVSLEEFNLRFSQMMSQAQQAQPDVVFDTTAKRREILDQLVSEKALEVAAVNSKLLKADDSIRKEIAREPMFQKDGKFDNQTFQGLLAANRMSEADYLRRVRESYQRNVLQFAAGSSSVVTERDIDDYIKLRDQTRNFRFISIDVNDLPAQAQPSDADIKKYFDTNSTRFLTTEFAEFEFIRVQAANLPKAVATTEVLKQRYEKDQNRFRSPERRSAAHILVNVEGGESASTDQQKAAQAVAAKIAERAKAGEDFAVLATANSQDLGSKELGGDLGFVEKGVLEPAFEAKLFAMKTGEISEPILTSQGYHIIKLGEVEAERVKSFDEARAELETEFNAQEGTRAFNEKAGKLLDQAMKDPRSLAAAAKAVALPVERTGMISGVGQPESGTISPVATNPEFLKAAFSAAVLERGQNSELITLGEGDQLVLRMVTRKKSTLKPLDSVKQEIVTTLIADRQAEALKAKADAMIKELAAGKSFEALVTDAKKTLETAVDAGRNAANRDPAISAEAFKIAAPVATKPNYAKAVLSADRIALIELTSVKDGDPKAIDTANRDSIRMQLGFEIGAAEAEAVKQSILKATEREIFEERLAQ